MPNLEAEVDVVGQFHRLQLWSRETRSAPMNEVANWIVDQGGKCSREAFLISMFGGTFSVENGPSMPRVALDGEEKAARFRLALGEPYAYGHEIDDMNYVPGLEVGIVSRAPNKDEDNPVIYEVINDGSRFAGTISVRGLKISTRTKDLYADTVHLAKYHRYEDWSCSNRDRVILPEIEIGVSAIRARIINSNGGVTPDTLGAIDEQISVIRKKASNQLRYPSPAVDAFID